MYGDEDAVERVAVNDDLIWQINGYRTLGLVFYFSIAETVSCQVMPT